MDILTVLAFEIQFKEQEIVLFVNELFDTKTLKVYRVRVTIQKDAQYFFDQVIVDKNDFSFVASVGVVVEYLIDQGIHFFVLRFDMEQDCIFY